MTDIIITIGLDSPTTSECLHSPRGLQRITVMNYGGSLPNTLNQLPGFPVAPPSPGLVSNQQVDKLLTGFNL